MDLSNLFSLEFKTLLKKREQNLNISKLKIPLSIFFIETSKFQLMKKNSDFSKEFLKYFSENWKLQKLNSFSKKIKKNQKELIDELLVKLASLKVLHELNLIDINPSNISLEKNLYGKPFVKVKKDSKINIMIYISISHKDDLNIAASGIRQNGIDIERIRSFNPSFLQKCFTNKELSEANELFNGLQEFNAVNDMDIIYSAMFSIKEAVSKALGFGLRINFKTMQLLQFNSNIIVEYNLNNYKQLFQAFLSLQNNYIFSLTEKIS